MRSHSAPRGRPSRSAVLLLALVLAGCDAAGGECVRTETEAGARYVDCSGPEVHVVEAKARVRRANLRADEMIERLEALPALPPR